MPSKSLLNTSKSSLSLVCEFRPAAATAAQGDFASELPLSYSGPITQWFRVKGLGFIGFRVYRV